MPQLTGCEFGDIIINHNYSNDNPKKIGIFIKENGVIHLTDTKGLYWTVTNDPGANLEVNGQIDFEKYLKDYNNKMPAVK